jgi:hypothetical protein
MTDLKLWELQVRERGPNHRNYVCDPLPSRSSASHGSERVLESSLDGLARHGIEVRNGFRIRAINRTDFGPLGARAPRPPAANRCLT